MAARLSRGRAPAPCCTTRKKPPDGVLAMVSEGVIITQSGNRLKAGMESICVHGDSPNAVAMAKAVRRRLEAAGIVLAPFFTPV